MKTFNKILTLLTAATLFAAGCVNEDPNYTKDEKPVAPGETHGFVALGGMNMRVLFDTQTEIGDDDTGGDTTRPTLRSATRTQPDAGAFIVEILDAANTSVLKTTYAELLEQLKEPMALEVGNYKMVVRSEENPPVAEWEHPIYGATKEFSIAKGKTTSIGEVICTLQNIKVTLMCSKDLADQLTDDTASTVTLGGNKAVFAKGEKRAVYFLPTADNNTLDFLLSGRFADTGGEVNFTKKINNVKAGQWRKITLVIAYIDKGDIKFDIKVDSFVQDETIIINGTDGLWEELYEPEIDPTAPTLTWTDNDFAKTIQLTESMFDAQHICSEPFELVLNSPNGVKAFDVVIGSSSNQFLTALDEMEIPRSFDLCTVSGKLGTVLTAFGFPIGSDVTGAKTKTFYIGGQLPWLLYGYNGTHTFEFTVTDANGLKITQTLSILVDQQNENTAPTIVWRGYDIDKQYTVFKGMQIDIDITAPAAIRSLVVTIISDALDEEELAGVGLPQTFDLANITDPELIAALGPEGLGLPVNDQVKNKTAMSIPITGFVDLLMMAAPGNNNFQVDVTDNQGTTTTKTVKLFVNREE